MAANRFSPAGKGPSPAATSAATGARAMSAAPPSAPPVTRSTLGTPTGTSSPSPLTGSQPRGPIQSVAASPNINSPAAPRSTRSKGR